MSTPFERASEHHRDACLNNHTEQEALFLARTAAHHLTVNGHAVQDVLARIEAREVTP